MSMMKGHRIFSFKKPHNFLESKSQHGHSPKMEKATKDSHIYETNLDCKGPHGGTSKMSLKKSSTHAEKACDNCYTTNERKQPQSENSESVIYCHCIPPFAKETDLPTAVVYSSIPEQQTAALTRVPSNYEDPIYQNVSPKYKVKLETPREENKSSGHKQQNEVHLRHKSEAAEISHTKPVPNARGGTPSNRINKAQEPSNEQKGQKHYQRCTDDVTKEDNATRVSDTKHKPVPRPKRLRDSCKEIHESEDPLEEYMERGQHEKNKATKKPSFIKKLETKLEAGQRATCKEMPETEENLKDAKGQTQDEKRDLTQKDKVPASKKKPQTELSPGQQTSCKEIPEIEEHLVEFRKQLKQQEGCRDITSMVVSNLNFKGRMMDKKGGCLQLKSHGVVLYIPPDALGDEPQEIYIYVQQNLKSSHHTVKNGFVSPIVHCGTSGLKFNLPVILTFPVQSKSSSPKLMGVRQDSSTQPWVDSSDCSSEVVLFHDGLCTVISDHFTGFGAVEQYDEEHPVTGPHSVKLRVGVFIAQHETIDPVNGCMQLRVRIWDESPETCEYIKQAEENSTAMDTQRRLFLNTKEDPNNHVFVEIKSLNEQWKTSNKTQVLPLQSFQMDTRVDESRTFNLKPVPRNYASNDNRRQLECDVSVSQRSHQMSAVVIRAVHEIKIRNQLDGLSMCVDVADSDTWQPQVYRDLFWYYRERQLKIESGALNCPIDCSDGDRQDQAGQANHPIRENYGHQVQQDNGIQVRNDQLFAQCQASQSRLSEQTRLVNQQVEESRNAVGNSEIGGNVEQLYMDSNDPSVNSNSQLDLQPNQISVKPKNTFTRLTNFIVNRFKKNSQPDEDFHPYSLPHDFPPAEAQAELSQGYLQLFSPMELTTTQTESYYVDIPKSH
ncbi:uncharacterized protein [Asterias amurensis]|uniref:uncharacterized protein n=1 Tax=Asterias amurensis TaxID=7602 RepID=UPI003AB568FF